MFDPVFGLGFLVGFATMGGIVVLGGFGSIWWLRYRGEIDPIFPVLSIKLHKEFLAPVSGIPI